MIWKRMNENENKNNFIELIKHNLVCTLVFLQVEKINTC